jgi:hypothetical protein
MSPHEMSEHALRMLLLSCIGKARDEQKEPSDA